MRRSLRKMGHEFRLYWKHYVFQSLVATAAVFGVLLFLSMQDAVIIASLGASTFIVFAMPNSLTAQTRNVVGGHLAGLLVGFCFSLVHASSPTATLLLYAAAVGTAIFVMVVTDTEHPPAAGTALGVAMTGISLSVLLVVLASIALLSLIHRLCKPWLRDLT